LSTEFFKLRCTWTAGVDQHSRIKQSPTVPANETGVICLLVAEDWRIGAVDSLIMALIAENSALVNDKASVSEWGDSSAVAPNGTDILAGLVLGYCVD
jgi:hypothetical protein